MRRTPLQQIGDRIGMYAYLTAIGSRQLWPRIRRLASEEYPRPAPEDPPSAALVGYVAQERDAARGPAPVDQVDN